MVVHWINLKKKKTQGKTTQLNYYFCSICSKLKKAFKVVKLCFFPIAMLNNFRRELQVPRFFLVIMDYNENLKWSINGFSFEMVMLIIIVCFHDLVYNIQMLEHTMYMCMFTPCYGALNQFFYLKIIVMWIDYDWIRFRVLMFTCSPNSILAYASLNW